MEFELVKHGVGARFVVEKEAFEGVKRIAKKVCRDVFLVTGTLPKIEEHICETEQTCKTKQACETEQTCEAEHICETEQAGIKQEAYQVVIGTLSNSPLLEEMERSGSIDVSGIRGKREVFLFKMVSPGKLVIAGSDKRGTIYGLFHISELLGVSPWVHFSDVVPIKKTEVLFTWQDNMSSKEPSVKYRGFFINDEWPAFGNWTFSHYGGFTAEMYDLIFETLLRLKGNYLWPAMWTSSFSLDGPGEENARLADCYGIVMSNSHHEPCLRHSEEWDLVRGGNTVYGNEWSYLSNKDGLLNYWRDGLLRSGKYENIITIGMRGERDSLMLGENAGLKENIELLKEIITEQRKLIHEFVGKEEPRMLALYKEVEAYYYGDEQNAGLKEWDGLEDVTLMLCEDNFGNMRTLPAEGVRNRNGGWGMYYHFDYHGAPVSYEWVNSSYLPKVWDQMTMAYDFGVREIWIVNVGDLKFQEYPLSFFMDLAYDYERWGSERKDAPKQYLKEWVKREFGVWLNAEQKSRMEEAVHLYTKMNHNCKPEVMRADTYHAVHFSEAEKQLADNRRLKELLEGLEQEMPEEMLPAFWELVYYPAMASVNVSDMQLYAGQNAHLAKLGAVLANDYAKKVKTCIRKDRELTEHFHGLLDGKWDGMGLSEHIGFVHWNDEECRYPVMTCVEPTKKPGIAAYAEGEDEVTSGGEWMGNVLTMRAFMQAGTNEGKLILLNTSQAEVEYTVECNVPGIRINKMSGTVHKKEILTVCVEKTLIEKNAGFVVHYEGGNIRVAIECSYEQMPECKMRTFLEADGLISIEAEHFAENVLGKTGAFYVLAGYGKTKSGVKAYPQEKTFFKESITNDAAHDLPHINYRVWAEEEGEYRLFFYTAPANPACQGGDVYFGYAVNGSRLKKVSLIPKDYCSGEPSCKTWAKMVLSQIRIAQENVSLQRGMNEISVFAGTPGFLLEKLVLIREGKMLPESYLGPEETYLWE